MEGSSSCYNIATLLILLVFTPNINSCSAARAIPEKASTEFIKKSCGTTRYPGLCFRSLSSYATAIQTSPKLLATTALSVSLTSARSTSTMMSTLSKSSGMKPREVAAMHDCVEEISTSIDELRKSIEEMNHLGKGSDIGLQINDIQTWVSAALTDDSTCMDGFAGNTMNGNVKTAVRGSIVKVAHLTSNALALINNLVAISPK